MSLRLVAVLASLAGVAISVYLAAVHYAGAPLACPTTATISCEAVLTSRYGVIAGTGIPTAAAGIAWFGINAGLWLIRPPLPRLVWSGVGVVSVLGLVFIEVVVLGAVCLWCTAAHLLVVGLTVMAVTRPSLQPGAPAA